MNRPIGFYAKLSEIGKTEENKYYMFSLICEF